MDSAQIPRPSYRRDIIKSLLGHLMSTLPASDALKADAAREKAEEAINITKPRALKKGDTVSIIAPSSPPFEPGDLEFTYKWLAKLGLKYKIGQHVFDSWSDYAGSDEVRLKDFHNALADPEVKAILPIRGGNGAVRLLPAIDFELIRQNPKILVGYSDITGLVMPIHQVTGLVTFHGPTAGSFYRSSYTYHYYLKAIMQAKPIGLVTDPEPKEPWKPQYPPTRLVIAEGKGRGRLTGGSMTLLRQLMGTPYEIETRGKLVFLEDLGEEPYSIDRVLSQLLLAGKLKDASGILVGECVNCQPGDSRRNVLDLGYSVENVLRERLGGLGIPVVYGMRFGHGGEQFTLPIGVTASLDASAQGVRFKIEESATV